MTDERNNVHGYSEDKQIYRHNSTSMRRKSLTQFHRTSENYYSNRNCPEIISLFALTNRHLEGREKQIYHSISNDINHFDMINYPIQTLEPTPIPNSVLKSISQLDKQPKLPKVTPRITPNTTAKKFPSLTSKGSTTMDHKNSMPTIRTSVRSISSSWNKPSQTKMPIVSTEKKKKIPSLHHSRQTE